MTAHTRHLALLLILCSETLALSGSVSIRTQKEQSTARDAEIAACFAPIFFQALGDKARSDYITNFDFDGDWRGDNNWNDVNKDIPLKAHIYYSVAETSTHFFIHYAVFHPRDYKGGEVRGAILSGLIREGAKHGAKYDPTGLADEAALAHENDMEGALVVVKKAGSDLKEAQVAFVETLHHNNFSHYATGDETPGSPKVKIEGQRALLYIEPKGHGIEAYVGDQKQVSKKDFLKYVYDGRADDPGKGDLVCSNLDTADCDKSVSYDLIPLSVLWAKATAETNTAFGVVFDYGEITLSTSLTGGAATDKKFKVGKRGCAFLGAVGGVNMARPPWGWFDLDERAQPLGNWFFDPANAIKRHFNLDSHFSTSYVRLPFWTK